MSINEQLGHIHNMPVRLPCELECEKEYKLVLRYDFDNGVWLFDALEIEEEVEQGTP